MERSRCAIPGNNEHSNIFLSTHEILWWISFISLISQKKNYCFIFFLSRAGIFIFKHSQNSTPVHTAPHPPNERFKCVCARVFFFTKKRFSLWFSKGIFHRRRHKASSLTMSRMKKKPWFTYWKRINCESCKNSSDWIESKMRNCFDASASMFFSLLLRRMLFIALKLHEFCPSITHNSKALMYLLHFRFEISFNLLGIYFICL